MSLNAEELKKIQDQAFQSLSLFNDLKGLEEFKTHYFGKKGIMTELLKNLSTLSIEEKRTLGKEINLVKDQINQKVPEKENQIVEELKQQKLSQEKIDITLPGKVIERGSFNPISLVIDDIIRIFTRMGFSVVDGPELEEEYYNFDALNIPEHHPARDDQDSFYITDKKLMRTQTSGVQIRVMEQNKPPLAVISPGKCYRKDAMDATHSPIFHQVEGLFVDKHVSFSDLKGVLSLFSKEMFGSNTKVRFRPDFFPFTEPSAEVAFTCFVCGGKGCPTCKRTGWIEIGGCGMVDPEVFKYVGINYEEYKGYAFGMGIERIAMFKYDIPDIRMLYENEIKFLNQFK